MKLVEPKEAPVEKPDKNMFDPKNFLAKVGAGKQVLEFHKNQHVFEQGDVADTVFFISPSEPTLELKMPIVTALDRFGTESERLNHQRAKGRCDLLGAVIDDAGL
jgi:hypothetical protein